MVKELVERIRQKDQRAMSQFYQQYVGELSSVCYRYVPSEDDAKDVLQNSFVKIFTSGALVSERTEEAALCGANSRGQGTGGCRRATGRPNLARHAAPDDQRTVRRLSNGHQPLRV